MRIVCLGGESAGLYFAISMKLRDPSHEVVETALWLRSEAARSVNGHALAISGDEI